MHEGICGAHQVGIKLRWLLRRYGYYWLTIIVDCIKHEKSYQPCQKHGPIQRVLAAKLFPILKPLPFRGWAMDLIGKINHISLNMHGYVIVAKDYFTKWMKTKLIKEVNQSHII